MCTHKVTTVEDASRKKANVNYFIGMYKLQDAYIRVLQLKIVLN